MHLKKKHLILIIIVLYFFTSYLELVYLGETWYISSLLFICIFTYFCIWLLNKLYMKLDFIVSYKIITCICKKKKSLNLYHWLVIINGADKTNSIFSIKQDANYWNIIYKNPVDAADNDPLKSISIHHCFKKRDANKYIIYCHDIPVSGVKTLLNFGRHVKLEYETGEFHTYPASMVKFEKCNKLTSETQNLLNYIKSVAQSSGIKRKDGESFLFKQIEKLSKISSKSALSFYLNQRLPKGKMKILQPYFPFGFNRSQKSATKKAILNQISVIQGPPGTGKTQTILNIIANAVIKERTVAVVSNNNSATANVLDKLESQGISFIAAYLGNEENKKTFLNNQRNYPDLNCWRKNSLKIAFFKVILFISGLHLDICLFLKNKLAETEKELSQLTTEMHYFFSQFPKSKSAYTPSPLAFWLKPDFLLSLWAQYQFSLEQEQPISIYFRFKLSFLYGFSANKFLNQHSDTIILQLQQLYYEIKERSLHFQISIYNHVLKGFSVDKIAAQCKVHSMLILKACLEKRFSGRTRTTFQKDTLHGEFKNFDEFIKEYPIILSSTHSIKNCIPEGYLFDYVIIDEASQVDLITGILAVSCAKNIVIVGDMKQLPRILKKEEQQKSDALFKMYGIDNLAYDYSKHSFLSSVLELFPTLKTTLLREHYRCHPKIIEFCNQRFYNNELIILTNHTSAPDPLVIYQTAEGNHARGRFNQRQIDVIFNEIIPTVSQDGDQPPIGIIAPYNDQVQRALNNTGNDEFEISTVHKFQGREKEIIILSTVANQVNEFISKPDLLNVAVSRAISQLYIIIANDDSFLNGNSALADLVRYIQYNNFEITESKILSVFDLLYSRYSMKLMPILSRLKNISEYKSENLMNVIIEDLLSMPQFQHLGRVLHVSLQLLIKDTSLLTAKQYDFAMNPATHVDFLIFNRTDKRPLLVIEVDGYKYHENNPKQLVRDEAKDAILQKCKLPVMRFSTIGSGEKERLLNMLEALSS